MKSNTNDFEHDSKDLADFLGFAGFGALPTTSETFTPLSLDLEHIQKYHVKQRYAAFGYLFQDQALDNLPNTVPNGTVSNTYSAVTKFDKWFASLKLNPEETPQLATVVNHMLSMDASFPPFVRVCFLTENDRGVILAHFTHCVKLKNGLEHPQANSKGLYVTAFQRVFRKFDAKFGLNSMSTMTSWKKHPSYQECKKQCVLQLKKDVQVPLVDRKKKNNTSHPMDLGTYRLVLDYLQRKQAETYMVNLKEFVRYCQSDFLVHTLVFGGHRGAQEAADLSIKFFEQLDFNLLNFLQSTITKGNQTGGDSNFCVKIKPDLYFLGEHLVRHFQMFHKRKTNPDGTFQNNRLFLRILPSATFEHLEWFGNEHVGKNHINWVGEITQEMQKANIIPSFLSYDNTSLRKLRTQVLSDAGVEDWMIAETIGHKDKKNQNLLYYRKMDHADKLLMAKVLSNPWRYTKKRTIVDEVDGIDTHDKENIHQRPEAYFDVIS